MINNTEALNTLLSRPTYLTIALCTLITALYLPSIYELLVFWWQSEEYNYGLLIPPITIYIFYQKRSELFSDDKHGSAWGLALLLFSGLLYLAAIIADIESIKRYCLILSLGSVMLTLGGWRTLYLSAFPALLLLFSLPLPSLLGAILTNKMQLISSDLGVWLIRFMGMPVFQDGNVINMSGFQMLVAEACSGLRYLYPLMAIALIISYFYKSKLTIKTLIFLSAIPITIGMNSLRIAITGLLIKHYGKGAAEGFLHDFEGWLVFVVAFILLIGGVYLISTVQNIFSKQKTNFVDRFDFASDEPQISTFCKISKHITIGFVALTVLFTISAYTLIARSPEASPPPRKDFSTFPFSIEQREIFPSLLTKEVKDVLRADDYFIADYKKPDAQDINLYMVYYENQKDGSALHSPKACLPGGGWRIQKTSTIELSRFGSDGRANRVVIEQSGQKLLVYYWIHQNGKNYANEFKARLSLLKQSITTGRTDGALIRIIRPIIEDSESSDPLENMGLHIAEQEIGTFIHSVMPILPIYLPH